MGSFKDDFAVSSFHLSCEECRLFKDPNLVLKSKWICTGSSLELVYYGVKLIVLLKFLRNRMAAKKITLVCLSLHTRNKKYVLF